jgi:sorting nexin-9/18/33
MRYVIRFHVGKYSLGPQPVVDTHKAALARYQESESGTGNVSRSCRLCCAYTSHTSQSPNPDAPEIAARCETVLNTTMAEFDTYHTQRGEDFTQMAVEYLDSEIELYEQVCTCFVVPGC